MLILFLHILRRSLSVKPHNNIRCSICHRYVTCPRFDHRYLRWYLLSWHRSRLGFVTPIVGEVSLGPLGNEIELGIEIPTIESRASNIPMTKKKRMLLCGLTDKDLRRICRSQYEHPGSAIGYWPEMSLGHVYIVLEPVGSARSMLRWRLYYEFICFDVPKEFGVPDEIGDMTRSLEMAET